MKKFENREVSIAEIIDSMPHGSGINGKYEWYKDTRGKFHIYNTFDYMDDNGFYDCYPDFEVVLYPTFVKVIMHPSTAHQKYIVRREMLREYLQDIYSEWFSNIVPIDKVTEKDSETSYRFYVRK